MADDKTKNPDEQKDGDNMTDDKTKKPDEKKDGDNVTDDKKKHKHENKRKHEKKIFHRINHNNIDLSHHAEHDWQTEHEKRRKEKMSTRKTREGDFDNINIRVYFQTLDRTSVTECGPDEGENVTYEWLPANHPVFDDDPLTPVPIPMPSPGNAAGYIDVLNYPGGNSAMNLLAKIEEIYQSAPPVPPIEVLFDCTPHPDSTPPDPDVPPAPLYYVSDIEIADNEYNITTEGGTGGDPGYTPDPGPDPEHPYPDGTDVDWLGDAWMFFDGPPGAPDWKPDDNDPWTPGAPGFKPDGEDEYPNGTLDEYHPLQDLLEHTAIIINRMKYYRLTFSYERQCFDFIYEGHEDENGDKHMALVIRPMRLHKKPADETDTTDDETKDDKAKDDETKDDV